jgi:thioredoxin-dependent peroxiredoxin
MLETGATAPQFTLPDQDGTPVSLSDFAGKTVVLYFYPKATTPSASATASGRRRVCMEGHFGGLLGRHS